MRREREREVGRGERERERLDGERERERLDGVVPPLAAGKKNRFFRHTESITCLGDDVLRRSGCK